jgi:hypothetical protein
MHVSIVSVALFQWKQLKTEVHIAFSIPINLLTTDSIESEGQV